ncbi:putative Autophagy protein [Seiridium cardinale]
MGWWHSLWGSNTTDDPLQKLDPKLREYLEKESPVKYTSSQPPSQSPTKPTTSLSPHELQSIQSEQEQQPSVPRESQFQDGRYAHLWKSYKPLAQVEAETKSDQEKIMDVLEGYKERKSQIGKAALENCALEQVDWRQCMSNPNITERFTMCRAEIKKFERCYNMQTRLLKALGYLSTADRSPEVEEDIQMHADGLYHKYLQQEAEIEAAKAEGRPVPKFAPLVPKKPIVAIAAPETELNLEQQALLKTRLEKVAEEDRPAEEQAFRAELRAKAELNTRIKGIWDQQAEERRARQESGQATTWDRIMSSVRSGSEKK